MATQSNEAVPHPFTPDAHISDDHTFDFLILGSGFGGSVSAMRLAEKGYKVAVLEKGKRWKKEDFPKSNWIVNRFLWAPLFRCFGIQQITLLKGVMVLHGSGVGGGSLVYANTLMEPADKVFLDPAWPKGIQWKEELKDCYQEAKRMLGVTQNRLESEADFLMKELGQSLNCEPSYHPTEVGVFFKEQLSNQKIPSEGIDPYFQGQGPLRHPCTGCGACMIGCRVGAKNTLDRNYLYFAEKSGAQIFPETRAFRIQQLKDGSYQVLAKSTTRWFGKQRQFKAKKVIVSMGVMGTVDFLFRNKDYYKTLPNLSSRLGDTVRTNGESLCGATSFETHRDLSKGIAIGSAIHPDEDTKIEPVRYPSGSDFMKFLAVPLTEDGGAFQRPLKLIKNVFLRAPSIGKVLLAKDWAKQTIILLVMQSIDRQMRLRMGKGLLGGLKLKGQATDKPIPSYLPIAQSATQNLAKIINGEPQNVISEVLLGTPATAHILGGCCMGDSIEDAVIDKNHEVFGYPGLYVCDGSVIPANLGVNPSLTITALAERFARRLIEGLNSK